MRDLIESAIADGVFPGAAWSFGDGHRQFRGFAGMQRYDASPKIEENTVWDLASLTKVVCTSTLAWKAVQNGRLSLKDRVQTYLPESALDAGIENLLLHNSGLVAFRTYQGRLRTRAEVWSEVFSEIAQESETVYSDLGFILLGRIIERVHRGVVLDQMFNSLRVGKATFRPKAKENCAPTEPRETWRPGEGYAQGIVHDPTAWLLGGVAGHAGLFSDLESLEVFAKRVLAGEYFDESWTTPPGSSSRAYGWDTNQGHRASAGIWPEDSFGHTGFTGTSIWFNRRLGWYALLLTNRVHPTATNTKILQFRPAFHEAVQTILLPTSEQENGMAV
jgi:CubicO group peptidase (beta-lactamase class C family)